MSTPDGEIDVGAVIDALKAYFTGSLPALLETSAESFATSLSSTATMKVLQDFVTDNQANILLVQKVTLKDSTGSEPAKEEFHFDLRMKTQSTEKGSVVVALIKSSTLDVVRPMAQQLHVCEINDKAPFQSILSYVRHCFLPFSRSLVAISDEKTDDIGVIKAVSGKLGELEIELARSQQNDEIPHVELEVHPKIANFASTQSGKLEVEALGATAADTTFLNELEKGLNEWKKQILAVTKRERDVTQGSTMDEMSFWLRMSTRLDDINKQLAKPDIAFTFEVLKQNKRFHATTAFGADTGLSSAGEKVSEMVSLTRDLPVKALLSSSDLNEIRDAIELIFSHLKQIKRINYPLARAVGLVHAISGDVAYQLRSVLHSRTLMAFGYDEFDKATQPTEKLFATWDDNLEQFYDDLRSLKKKQNRTGEALDVSQQHVALAKVRSRIGTVRKIRKQHHNLEKIISETLSSGDFERNQSLNALDEAYQTLQQVDVLDTSPEGVEVWDRTVIKYNEIVSNVDKELEAKIRELLKLAKDDFNEMFRVCARFNPLFERAPIKAAIREYQAHLIETVKNDINVLMNKYKNKYSGSEALRMSKLRDLPIVSGQIIWARQIERQLDAYMQRVEDVLGKKWHHHVEGKRLRVESDNFRKMLQPQPIFEKWLESLKDLDKSDDEERIFKIVETAQQTSLAVNFDRKMIELFKEVRNLTRLGLKIPYEIKITAEEARAKYPFAMRLEEVINIYARTCVRLDADRPDMLDIAPLAAVYKKKVQERIQKGILLQWDMEKLKEYVDKLSTAAVEFQDQVDEILSRYDTIHTCLNQLETCKPERFTFRAILAQIQDVIEHFDKRGFSNLQAWVKNLDDKVEERLVRRLREIITYWSQALDHAPGVFAQRAREEEERRTATTSESRETLLRRGSALVSVADFVPERPIKHEIQIRNQLLQVDPPLEYARLSLSKDFQGWLAAILELPRLRLIWSTANQELESKTEDDLSKETFRSALSKLTSEEVSVVFDAIEDKVQAASAYVETWLQYQALWDMDMDMVANELGDDIPRWEQLIVDMKKSRATFDNFDTRHLCGPILIEYGSVQAKVNDKYDSWHKMIMSRFGHKVGDMLTVLYKSLQGGRKTLETSNIDFGTTADIVNSVTILQELNHKSKTWKAELETQKTVEKLLQRQRFLFPEDWLFCERVQHEYNAFEQILSRKLAQMHAENKSIQRALNAEDELLSSRVKELHEDWQTERPIQGDLNHEDVKGVLDKFTSRLDKLDNEITRLNRAKAALEMPVREETRLKPIKEELQGLHDVWGRLGALWNQLEDIKNTLFRDLKPIDLRRHLTRMQTDLTKLPNHMRTYGAYDHLKSIISGYLQMNGPMVELNSGILRPKHQKMILKEIGITDTTWRDLTVGRLWKQDLRKHLKAIRYVLEQAQGENALEEFLSEISNIWEHFKLELVDYRGKCFLIRNWDPVFEQLGDHLGDLHSMKQSPYFHAFEREATEWEETLNRAQAIFDVFIDVQRRWVYLEGIFTNSQDVQHQLEHQWKRFRTFDREFVRLMREIKRDPSIMYWINSERGLLPRMEGYAEILNGIQKALGEYLERQRAAFPRFYFVGDEDLLEIIGNAKNPIKIIRHLPKMFAAIASLKLSENGQVVFGMLSKEGEEVLFKEKIAIAENSSIHEWLNKVQHQMQYSLASLLEEVIRDFRKLTAGAFNLDTFFELVHKSPAQIIMLAVQVYWSEAVDAALQKGDRAALTSLITHTENVLKGLASRIINPMLRVQHRKKYEQLVTELVHQRDTTRLLVANDVHDANDYTWLSQLRFYFNPAERDVMKKLEIRISRATFYYGFEYLGVGERIVQTPLTDRVYLTMCEALHMRMGGNPFGPAGTGKTETVKALGALLGRFVLVFNCDERFDFNAMGRIFIGLCQCGAWGCFDEFNRLEERILSAVSQQILRIQSGLREHETSINLLDRQVSLDDRMGIFVTMNPGYAGRSNLPDNLKQLFRGIAMIKPDWRLIGEVMLYSQGFSTAEELAGKIVLLFQLCSDQLSSQSHYDWGLRALKSVLRSAGNLKRQSNKDEEESKNNEIDLLAIEKKLLVRSISESVVPKLVAADTHLFKNLLTAVFPSAEILSPQLDRLREEISRVADERHYQKTDAWMDKCLQLYQIQEMHHGVIMVGPSGTGKSSVWKTLLTAMDAVDNQKSESYVIDPKSLSKDDLYGLLDSTTLEWTDGVFTHILRKIIDNQRGEANKRHWIIFDGDVDPEWAENLNSVLDDNKLLTLPNGERLALTPNIRIMFEVKDLHYATPATVSRCGMVWFSEEVVETRMIMYNMLQELRSSKIESISAGVYNRWKSMQNDFVDTLSAYFNIEEKSDGPESMFVASCLEASSRTSHVMEFSRIRMLGTMISLLKTGLAKAIEYNDNHVDFPLSSSQFATFASKYLVFSVLWGFGGDMSLADRLQFCEEISRLIPSSVSVPSSNPLIDYEVRVDSQEWELWSDRIEQIEIEPHKIVAPDMVIDTVDTARHTDIVYSWLHDHKPLLLCGPPGSGKSMTLTAVLQNSPQFELVTLNFSSTTTPDLILHVLDHYCRVDRTPNGLVMRPSVNNKWLVIFCDEINLPANDDYSTQHVITFLRQVIEQGGFWRASDHTFITLDHIQIVGACNPPTDAGRVAMSPRFLRHAPLLFVDFPAAPSLKQIYGTFNRALLKLTPSLRPMWEGLTNAMIDFYVSNQTRFTPENQPHYIYSPRELSRWVRAMYEALKTVENASQEEVVRLWLHEALRLFSDRLVEEHEREWASEHIDKIARKHFPNCDHSTALARPVLFSNWLSKRYVSVDQEELREHVIARLHVFNEEELDVKLVIFDEVLEHILRIDRVLRQPLGHCLLVGASGAGKTILSKFVSWMNGMSVFQIKVHSKYTAKDFDKDLRTVLTRAGAKGEKICFIFDESNVLNTAFLERMNALLASGEVPGLFEGAEFKTLMTECRDAAKRDGVSIESEEELYTRFNRQVQRNLHVVFTMNPLNDDFDNRSATSPALFNRCVVDWFGEWSSTALQQVGFEFTRNMDLGDVSSQPVSDEERKMAFRAVPGSQRESIVNTLVYVHESVREAMEFMAKQRAGRSTYVTPRHFLDFIKHYEKLFHDKREQIEDQQRHLNQGLRQLNTTREQVLILKEELRHKETELEVKTKAANEKLNQMLFDQKEAENKRDASIRLGEEIKVSQGKISERRVKVEDELQEAEPALLAAQQSVSGIKKAQLVELASFRQPPALVVLAMEPLMLMLGESSASWGEISKTMKKSDFIPRIINFDTESLSDATRLKIEKKYVSSEDFTYEKINKASKVCGPLVMWIKSQLNFNRILMSVEPLQNEMKSLENEAVVLANKQEELISMVDELEGRIATYKDEYAILIREAETIKAEMQNVKTKVQRSTKLIDNLSIEQKRWEEDSQGFVKQMETVTGDCLVAAAFLAYIGYFNQQYRQMLVQKWQDRLVTANVKCKEDLSIIEYLSNPQERLEWQSNNLPDDDLCVENAVMIKKFNRYPLIIDPSGQATDFLMTHYKERKIIRTSFLDDSFLKNLESALRFGNALLVEDVESMDPVLNSVLNREIFKTGGRVMITLGDKEIDFSPTFTIFLATRDPTVHFTPDLCSRVTFVNFTVTHSSLTTQCLGKILKAERPDIDRKRSDWLKLQGAFRVRLRSLEDSVLMALNNVRGNILEDDKVMTSLETLKVEAAEVQQKMRDSDVVLEEIQTVSEFYRGFALACSHLYFTLENLGEVSILYQFSLNFFLEIVDGLLFGNADMTGVTGEKVRLAKLTREMFYSTYNRVCRGLLQEHRLAFSLRIAQLYLEDSDDSVDDMSLDFLLRAKLDSAGGASNFSALKLSKAQNIMLSKLVKLPQFASLEKHISGNVAKWASFCDPLQDANAVEVKDDEDEDNGLDFARIPTGWESSSRVSGLFQRLVVTKVVRPDLLVEVSRAFVTSAFKDSEFLDRADNFSLNDVVAREINCRTPLLLVSRPGYDASGRVDSLAMANNKRFDAGYQSFAMGSPEGYARADEAVRTAMKNGTWVLLKNVHLSPSWLNKLEKTIHIAQPHQNFRLFMTMELSERVPVNLLRQSQIIMYEPPVGIKSSLTRTFLSLNPDRVNKAPAERSRLYFLLAWLHAVVLERLRYRPVGWTKGFEFSEADQLCAMDAIDEWVDRTAQGRANLPPNKIPWSALQQTMETVIYGGRIDNQFDQRRLEAFVRSLFTAKSYNVDHPLAFSTEGNKMEHLLSIPDVTGYDAFKKWIHNLPDQKNPELLGLPSTAELLILERQARMTVRDLLTLQEHNRDELASVAKDSSGEPGKLKKNASLLRRNSFSLDTADASRPEWMGKMSEQVAKWLDRIPTGLRPLQRDRKALADPLFRSLEREMNRFSELLNTVLADLRLAKKVLDGSEKPSNPMRVLFQDIQKDRLPKRWNQYVTDEMSISIWIEDFASRIELMQKIQGHGPGQYGRRAFWLGGLTQPEAIIAATRQATAQSLDVSLEELHLDVTVAGDANDKPTDNSFSFDNFEMFGASWDNAALSLSRQVSTKLPTVRFTWKHVKDVKEKENTVTLPVYLNSTRQQLLFSVNLRCPESIPKEVWAQRGACICVWRPPV